MLCIEDGKRQWPLLETRGVFVASISVVFSGFLRQIPFPRPQGDFVSEIRVKFGQLPVDRQEELLYQVPRAVERGWAALGVLRFED